MCLYPRLRKNRRYLPSKKNGGIVPPCSDDRKRVIPVGCGDCMECRKQRANGWSVRLKEEIRNSKLKAYFMTWTFSDESMLQLISDLREKGCLYDGYKLDNEICTIAMRRYLGRWKKKYGKSLRHWAISELGQTNSERVHMHGIVWTDEDKEDIVEKWSYGFCDIGKKGVGEDSCGYLVKYMTKVDERHREFKSKVLTSPGIGRGYLDRRDSKLNRFKGKETNEEYRDRKGFKAGLPMYYRLKLWDDDEREELWMNKLDEEVRWIDGIKVDVSTERGMKSYENLRKVARGKNKRYGFGDGKIDWDKRRYERALRNLKKKDMIVKVKDVFSKNKEEYVDTETGELFWLTEEERKEMDRKGYFREKEEGLPEDESKIPLKDRVIRENGSQYIDEDVLDKCKVISLEEWRKDG